ncbi:MAG TPA: hypothetical protein DDZ80_24345 [Cyanobacteria bacterium UBA8803]|nr:hypothetical protein [Cyanobacteria bacterium UBA9273]HBL61442.1 hypothetical protein [Cyanobacteria bacterium UBA8803]
MCDSTLGEVLIVNGKTIVQISQTKLDQPEIISETNTQVLTQQLLEELHKASNWQKQTLAEAAVVLQGLLKQLEETNPAATAAQQRAFITECIASTHREQFLSALQAGWKELIKEFLDNPYLNIGIETLEGWKNAD